MSSVQPTAVVSIRRVDDAWARFLDDVQEALPAVAVRAADAITAQSEPYERAGPGMHRAVVAVCVRSHTTLVRLWREDRDATAEEVEALVAIGLPPPETGISLEDVLQAYRTATEVLWHSVGELAERRQGLQQARLLAASSRGFGLLNQVSTGITRTHLEALQHEARRRTDAEQALVDALLVSPPRLADAHTAARALGLDVSRRWWVLVARSRTPGVESDLVSLVRERLRARTSRPVVGRRDDAAVAVVDGDELAPASVDAIDSAVVGLGMRHEGMAGVRTSYEEALDALLIADRRGHPLVAAEAAWLDRLLLGAVSPATFADVVLRPLAELDPRRRTTAEETLSALLDAGGSVTAAARALHLHPQSVRYRLRKLQARFGPALDDPRGRLALRVALEAAAIADPAEQPQDR